MRFSERLKKEEGLTLGCYGVSDFPQKHSEYTLFNFNLMYASYKSQQDVVSLEDARCLLVSIAESLLKEINSDPAIRDHLVPYPLTYNEIELVVSFRDENHVGLGNGGIQSVDLYEGKIIYDRYEIKEYTPPIPLGRSFLVHKEDYTTALNLVKSQGCLKEL
jgi:hypothetical protein